MTSDAMFLQQTEDPDQTVLREYVPFCAGDANDLPEIRLACVCRKPFDSKRADQEPSSLDRVFLSVQQSESQGAEDATETRNAFMRSEMGNEKFVRTGAQRRKTPFALC